MTWRTSSPRAQLQLRLDSEPHPHEMAETFANSSLPFLLLSIALLNGSRHVTERALDPATSLLSTTHRELLEAVPVDMAR
jgi:hypothetical protein